MTTRFYFGYAMGKMHGQVYLVTMHLYYLVLFEARTNVLVGRETTILRTTTVRTIMP